MSPYVICFQYQPNQTDNKHAKICRYFYSHVYCASLWLYNSKCSCRLPRRPVWSFESATHKSVSYDCSSFKRRFFLFQISLVSLRNAWNAQSCQACCAVKTRLCWSHLSLTCRCPRHVTELIHCLQSFLKWAAIRSTVLILRHRSCTRSHTVCSNMP